MPVMPRVPGRDLAALQALSAFAWTVASILVMTFVIVAAHAGGLSVGFAPWPSAKALLFVAALGALAWSCRNSAPRSALAIASFLALTVTGAAAGILSMVGQMFAFPLIDGALAAGDELLGITAGDVVGAIVAVPGAPKLLGVVYIFSVGFMFMSAFALSCLGRAERVWELCAASAFCITVATICSILLPAAGAFEYLGLHAVYGRDLPGGSGVYHLETLHALRTTSHMTIDPFRPLGLVTFPSFHTAMALMTAAAWRDDRFLRWPMFAWNAVVIVSTVPIGGHYLVDLIAGAAVWWVIFRYGTGWSEVVSRSLSAPPAGYGAINTAA